MSRTLEWRPSTSPAAATPLSGWRRLIEDTLVVAGSTTLCHLLGVATSLLIRSWLSPSEMGVWQGLKLVLNYSNYANLGTSKGAAQELSLARGNGDERAAHHAVHVAHTANVLSSLVCGLGLCVVAACVGLYAQGPWIRAWTWGLVAMALLAALHRHVTFRITLLRARQVFRIVSRLAVADAVFSLVVLGWAAWVWGLAGVFAGSCLVMFASLVLVCGVQGERLRWVWDPSTMRRLALIGAPVLMVGLLTTLFRSLDRLMILAFMPNREEQLGQYSLALLVTAQLYGFANMVSVAAGPRYPELYGRTKDAAAVAGLVARASELQALVLGAASSAALVAAPVFLARVLPAYHRGLAPLAPLVLGTVALGLALPLVQFQVAVNRQRLGVIALALVVGFAAGLDYLAILFGTGLVGIAWTACVADWLYFVALATTSIWPILDRDSRWRYASAIAIPVVVIALVSCPGWHWLLPHSEDEIGNLATKALTFACIWAGIAWWAWSYGGWRSAWQNGGV